MARTSDLSDRDIIRTLIYTYAERLDAGGLEGVAQQLSVYGHLVPRDRRHDVNCLDDPAPGCTPAAPGIENGVSRQTAPKKKALAFQGLSKFEPPFLAASSEAASRDHASGHAVKVTCGHDESDTSLVGNNCWSRTCLASQRLLHPDPREVLVRRRLTVQGINCGRNRAKWGMSLFRRLGLSRFAAIHAPGSVGLVP